MTQFISQYINPLPTAEKRERSLLDTFLSIISVIIYYVGAILLQQKGTKYDAVNKNVGVEGEREICVFT